MRADADLVQRISRSEIYSEYEKAFGDGTGLPLKIRPVEFWNLAHHNRRSENPFCALMAQTNRSCAACLEVQQQASDMAKEGPATFTCFAGLCDTTVPIKLGNRTWSIGKEVHHEEAALARLGESSPRDRGSVFAMDYRA